MRPLGAAGQHPEAGVLLPSAFQGFDDSVLGDPIAYAQCEQIPGRVTIGHIQYVLMAHSGGDGCFVCTVHSRWIRVR